MYSNKEPVGYPCLILCHGVCLFFTVGSIWLCNFNVNLVALISAATFSTFCAIFLLLKNKEDIVLADWKYLLPTIVILILMMVSIAATVFCTNTKGILPFLRILPASAVCYGYLKTVLEILEMKSPKSIESIKQILSVSCQNFTEVMMFGYFACLLEGVVYGGVYWTIWLGLTIGFMVIWFIYWIKCGENYGKLKNLFNIQ